jgi:predicted nucleic acid-binding Zn ribbon protein
VKRRRERFSRTRHSQDAADALAAVIEHYKLAATLEERRVLTEWREVVGPRIAGRTWPGAVRNGLLTVRVTNSAWMQELTFIKAQLLHKLRERFGDMVTDVRFTLGQPGRAARDTLGSAERGRRRPQPTYVPPEIPAAEGADLERIRVETENVDDDELRAVIFEARRRLNV